MTSIRRERGVGGGGGGGGVGGSGPIRSYSVRNRPTTSPFQSSTLPSNHISSHHHPHPHQHHPHHLHPTQRGHSWHNVERIPSSSLNVYKDDPRTLKYTATDIDALAGQGPSSRHHQFKTCCRSITTFMCTQVGVGGIIVCYAIMGAFTFMSLETTGNPRGNDPITQIAHLRNVTAKNLHEQWIKNQWSPAEWEGIANVTLQSFQAQIVEAFKKGYDGRTVEAKWTFPSALMFTLSIFTMIGYGNLVPRTEWGKVITMFYAVFGIPLYVLYFLNMGRALARAFKLVYIKLSSCQLRRPKNDEYLPSPSTTAKHSGGGGGGGSASAASKDSSVVVVPSTASIYVLIVYIIIGTIMFAEWEGWEYLDSVYFCVISLCKIGLGDFVPGTNIQEELESNQTKLIINFIYLLLGLGLVAMCYNLLKEEVLAKMKELKGDAKYIFHYVKNECGHCTGGHQHIRAPGMVQRRSQT